MISPGYKITATDIRKLKELKKTMVYGTYLKSIASSPVYNALMEEHITKVDIVPDLEKLKEQGRIPQSVESKSINEVFKLSLSRMAIGIAADAIILKEMEDVNVDDIIGGLRKDADLTYLTGMADPKYYRQAKRMLEEGKLTEDSLEYRGLMEYMKIHGDGKLEDASPITELEPQKPEGSVKKTKWDVDLSEDNIRI